MLLIYTHMAQHKYIDIEPISNMFTDNLFVSTVISVFLEQHPPVVTPASLNWIVVLFRLSQNLDHVEERSWSGLIQKTSQVL